MPFRVVSWIVFSAAEEGLVMIRILQDTSAKLFRSHSVPKRLDTIKCDHRNVIFVALQQLRVTLDIHFVERVLSATGGAYSLLGLFAEVATRSGVENDFGLHG